MIPKKKKLCNFTLFKKKIQKKLSVVLIQEKNNH